MVPPFAASSGLSKIPGTVCTPFSCRIRTFPRSTSRSWSSPSRFGPPREESNTAGPWCAAPLVGWGDDRLNSAPNSGGVERSWPLTSALVKSSSVSKSSA
jgi:hypothetical protein